MILQWIEYHIILLQCKLIHHIHWLIVASVSLFFYFIFSFISFCVFCSYISFIIYQTRQHNFFLLNFHWESFLSLLRFLDRQYFLCSQWISSQTVIKHVWDLLSSYDLMFCWTNSFVKFFHSFISKCWAWKCFF